MPIKRDAQGRFVAGSGKSGVSGVDRAIRNIERKERSIQKRFVDDCRSAANLVRSAGRTSTLFTDRTGTLRKAIRTKLQKNRRGKVRFKVGVDAAKARHGWLVEHGHNLVRKGRLFSRRVGKVAPRHYMLEAFESTKTQAFNIIRDGIKAALRA